MSTALKIGVIIGYIAIISFIATYLGKGTKTFKDFAIGGSKIPWYIMGGTLFSTFCGGATMVAYVGNFYSQGLIWIWIPIQVVLVGVIYLFLRGVDAADPRSGIFSTRPDAELINKMDNLFAANTEEMA